jgi:hypothetical protein
VRPKDTLQYKGLIAFRWVAHASRLLVLAFRQNNLPVCFSCKLQLRDWSEKSANAKRIRQHARRVRYPNQVLQQRGSIHR